MKKDIVFLFLGVFLLICCKSPGDSAFIGYAHELANGKWGFMDEHGEDIIAYRFDYARDFSEGLAVIRIQNKYGYLNPKGKIVIPLLYDQAYSFKNGLAKVVQNGLEGVITAEGKMIVPCQYQDLEICYEEAKIKARRGNKYGYIDFSGRPLVPFDYEFIGRYDATGAAQVCKNGKYGFIDFSGKEILACLYTHIQPFGPQFYKVSQDSLYGLIYKNDKQFALPCEYQSFVFCDEQKDAYSPDIIKARLHEKSGLLDDKAIPLTEFVYDQIGDFDTAGLALVERNGKYGYINRSGKEIMPVAYENICNFGSKLFRIEKNKKYGLFNESMQEIVPCMYEAIGAVDSGLFRITKEGLYGLLNDKGEVVLPCRYKDISVFARTFYRHATGF